jgi:hypothetical protein
MPLNSDTYDRRDYLEDELPDVVDRRDDYDPIEGIIDREDEMIWAWSRDPETDLTQVEARDRAQSHDYGDRYNLTQSSVSRKLSKLDDEMLTEPLATLSTDRGRFDYNAYRRLEKQSPEYIETLRCWLAKTLCDWHALQLLEPSTAGGEEGHQPPQWALDRIDYAADPVAEWQ